MSDDVKRKQKIIDVAAGRAAADIVLKNARYVNVFSEKISEGDIAVCGGMIAGVGEYSGKIERDVSGMIVCPGFIDSHIHLESSLVSPAEFARAVIPRGTTTVVTDPHEIANVMGTDGIEYMLEVTEGLPIDVMFMIPSCVPATPYDESGAALSAEDIELFYGNPRVLGLAEMMDFPGTVAGNELCLEKIEGAESRGLKVDGHAPGMTGRRLNAYIAAGVGSDHECGSADEAIEKIELGQVIMIREGTAAKDLDSLMPLLTGGFADRCVFCTDDKHPSDLISRGHIDECVRRAVLAGADPIKMIKAASFNAARYFGMNDRGAVAPGYIADLVIADDIEELRIDAVMKNGRYIFDGETADFKAPVPKDLLAEKARATFIERRYTADDLIDHEARAVIGMIPGSLATENRGYADHIDTDTDILKLAVIERHRDTGHVGMGYITGYGLKKGAVATSFAHDSHNIIVVGTSEKDMAEAVNRLIAQGGGISVFSFERQADVALEIAGLMTDRPLDEVNNDLEYAKKLAAELGVSAGIDPFMTLSFMSLPVIPELRLTTRGVFDVTRQCFI